MKNLKKNILTTLAFVFAFTAAFGWDVSKLAEVPLFREIPSTWFMENITTQCTVNAPWALCSYAGFPSEGSKYWNNYFKTSPQGGIPSTSVFVQRL